MFHIVLVEPEIPQNTGNVARTCACTGSTLHLVRPLGFAIDDRKLKRAGLDYWHALNILYYDSLEDFLQKHADDPLYFFTTKAKNRHSDVSFPDGAYLVFGKETAGLPEEMLRRQDPARLCRIPMKDDLRSLNLSNSVAIAVYEALRQHDYFDLNCEGNYHHEPTD